MKLNEKTASGREEIKMIKFIALHSYFGIIFSPLAFIDAFANLLVKILPVFKKYFNNKNSGVFKMKKLNLFLTLIICLLVSVSGYAQTVTLLHVNDTHSHLEATGPRDAGLNAHLGGLEKAASVIGYLKMTEPNSLFLHAGDYSVGDLFYNLYYGVPELQILKELGCDALAVGNHEFDFGPEALKLSLDAAFTGGGFPLISANTDVTGYPLLDPYIDPYVVKTVNGVKIGIFGLTIPSPLSNAAPVVISDDIFNIAGATVTQLKVSEGCDVVVCLSHLGSYLDKAVASNIPYIDFIIGSHDHYVFPQPLAVNNPLGKAVYIVQAGEYYKYVGKLTFTYEAGNVTLDNYMLVPADETTPEEPTVSATVEYLKSGIIAQFGDVYGTVEGTAVNNITKLTDPSKNRKDSPLGNLVTDAYRYVSNAQIGITAAGLLAEDLYQGYLTSNDLFRSVSYGYEETSKLDFPVATFEITGAELIKGLEIALSQVSDMSEDFLPQVSGMSFVYNAKKPAGSKVLLGSVHIGGKQINLGDTYTAASNIGLIGLLDGLGVVITNVNPTGHVEFTALKAFVNNLYTIDYKSEGRIKMASNYESDSPATENPFKFGLKGNYPNPFNPETKIRFEIPENGNVKVVVFDMLGRQVAELINADMNAGLHEVKWNAKGLSSGIYFCRLVMHGKSDVIRLMLLK